MAATQFKIMGWFMRGLCMNATHLMIVCDTFSNEDYPVYVMPKENARKKYKKYHGTNAREVVEIYSLRKDMRMQIEEVCAFHLD